MSVEYNLLSVKETIGGTDDEYNDDYMLSQSQHVIVDNEKYYVSMMLNRNFRMIAKADKAVVDASLDFDVKLAAGMCFHGDDEIIVVDNNDDKLVVCNRSDGSFIKEFATQLDKPNGIASDGEGLIIVGEVGDTGKQARCFDSDGNEKFTIKSVDSKNFSGVNYVSYDKANKRVIITDTDDNSVHVFASNGTHQFSIAITGDEPGQLSSPAGTAVDHLGNILVCDSANNRVQVFDKEGKFVSLFGADEPFLFPLDVYVTPDNEVVILDGSIMSGWSRLQVFQY